MAAHDHYCDTLVAELRAAIDSGDLTKVEAVAECLGYQHDESNKGPQGNAHWRGIVVLNDVEDGSFDPMPVSLDYLCRRYAGHRIADHTGVEL